MTRYRILSPLSTLGAVDDVVDVDADGLNVRALVRSRIIEPVDERDDEPDDEPPTPRKRTSKKAST